MLSLRKLAPLVLLLCSGLGAALVNAADADNAQSTPPALSAAQLEALIGRLEDPGQRDELIATLRTLAQVGEQADAEPHSADVKTAAADAVDLLANRVSELGIPPARCYSSCSACLTWQRAGSTICA